MKEAWERRGTGNLSDMLFSEAVWGRRTSNNQLFLQSDATYPLPVSAFLIPALLFLLFCIVQSCPSHQGLHSISHHLSLCSHSGELCPLSTLFHTTLLSSEDETSGVCGRDSVITTQQNIKMMIASVSDHVIMLIAHLWICDVEHGINDIK